METSTTDFRPSDIPQSTPDQAAHSPSGSRLTISSGTLAVTRNGCGVTPITSIATLAFRLSFFHASPAKTFYPGKKFKIPATA
jgi:hypothetical protein